MDEGQRLQYLIYNCCNGSAASFARAVNIDKAYLSRIVHGQLKMPARLVGDIISAFPDVNPEWLRTGEGYPGDLSKEIIKAKYEKIIAEKDALIKTLQMVIEKRL